VASGGEQKMNKTKRVITKLFFLFQALLFVIMGYILVNDTELFLIFIIGVLMVLQGWRKQYKTKDRKINLFIPLGLLVIMFAGLSTGIAWFMIFLTLVYLVLFGSDLLTFSGTKRRKKSKVDYVPIETSVPTPHQRERQKWFGDQKITGKTFPWDDIQLNSLLGDTIIDLGETILPNGDNYIVISKGIGDTKIIVPPGIGISLHQRTIYGEVDFLNETIALKNEQLKIYSTNYDQSVTHIKIINNTVLGDVEVIVL